MLPHDVRVLTHVSLKELRLDATHTLEFFRRADIGGAEPGIIEIIFQGLYPTVSGR